MGVCTPSSTISCPPLGTGTPPAGLDNRNQSSPASGDKTGHPVQLVRLVRAHRAVHVLRSHRRQAEQAEAALRLRQLDRVRLVLRLCLRIRLVCSATWVSSGCDSRGPERVRQTYRSLVAKYDLGRKQAIVRVEIVAHGEQLEVLRQHRLCFLHSLGRQAAARKPSELREWRRKVLTNQQYRPPLS